MKRFFYILGLVCALQAQAAEPIKVSSDIKQATVYLKGAVLKNKAIVNIPAGASTLLFTGLSYNIQQESIRLKPEGCQILSVTLKKNYLDLEQLDGQVKKMQEELKKLQQKNADDANLLGVYEQEKQLILNNKVIGGENNGVDPEKLKATADFYRQRLSEILEKTQAIKAEKSKTDKRINELRLQINQSTSKNIYPTSEIEVSITAAKAVNAQFDIEYYITEAGWFPTYDFRVNDLTSPMEIDYIAQIYQNSGFDWKNVEVTVSSSDPGNNGGMPVAQPWYVSPYNYQLQYDKQKLQTEINKVSGRITDAKGKPIPYAIVSIENSSVGGNSDFEGKFELALPSGAKNLTVSATGYKKQTVSIYQNDLQVTLYPEVAKNEFRALEDSIVSNKVTALTKAEINRMPSMEWSSPTGGVYSREGDISGRVVSSNVTTATSAVSVEYTLKEKMTIPSDGRPYTSQIMKREILAEYKHFATPKLARDAYLNVFIPNWEKLNLLEGEVNLYFGNSYTGKSVVSLRNLKDSLEFSMGKDPNVKIQRTLTYQKTTGGGVLPNKTGEYRWSTEIRNAGTMPVKLTVTEPFPVSVEKEIKVELNKELSNATVNKEKGLLTWDITLQPGEQKKLDFGFSISYPKNLNIKLE